MTFLFETCIVASGADGIISIALINTDPLKRENVMIAICGPTAARALCSALKEALESAENGNGDN